MNRDAVIAIMNEAKRLYLDAVIELTIPNQEDTELIVVSPRSVDSKIDYYLNTYDADGVHMNNSQIRMVGAGIAECVAFHSYTGDSDEHRSY